FGWFTRLVGIHYHGPYPAPIPIVVAHQKEPAFFSPLRCRETVLSLRQFSRRLGERRFQRHYVVAIRNFLFWIAAVERFYPKQCRSGRRLPTITAWSGRYSVDRDLIG